MSVRVVGSYGDLITDDELDVAAADAVAIALTAEYEFVAWVPRWLLSQKDIPCSKWHDEIVAGSVVVDGSGAYLVSVDSEESWLPKSQIRVYVQAADAEIYVSGTAGVEE